MHIVDEKEFERELQHFVHSVTSNIQLMSDVHNGCRYKLLEEILENYFKSVNISNDVYQYKVSVCFEPMTFNLRVAISWQFVGQFEYKHMTVTLSPDCYIEETPNYNFDLVKDCVLLEV